MNRLVRPTIFLTLVFIVSTMVPAGSSAGCLKEIKPPPTGYRHDRWMTRPVERLRQFEAFIVSFDGEDDDDGFGGPDALGIPHWVAMEVRRFDGECIQTAPRPSSWCTDDRLNSSRLAPTDASYRYSRSFRSGKRDWYDRGHLAMKFLAERISNDAAWNTHTVLNAVPQRHIFNAGIWLDLENLTGAWAQQFGAVWVVAGPIMPDGATAGTIGETEKQELPVVVPDALFKIVIREADPTKGEPPDRPQVLAFIYPQVGPGYMSRPYDHRRFLVSVDEIEERVGLDFLSSVPDQIENEIEAKSERGMWTVSKDDFVTACRP